MRVFTKRKLRFQLLAVPTTMIGICEFCNRKFQSTYSNPIDAKIDIRAQFNWHICDEEKSMKLI